MSQAALHLDAPRILLCIHSEKIIELCSAVLAAWAARLASQGFGASVLCQPASASAAWLCCIMKALGLVASRSGVHLLGPAARVLVTDCVCFIEFHTLNPGNSK